MYKARTLIPGFRLNLEKEKYYVAVPKKKFSDGQVRVQYEDEYRDFIKKDIKAALDFKDKYGRGKYTLLYFCWDDVPKPTLF